MKRTTCGSCGHDDLKLCLDLGSSPIADAYTRAPLLRDNVQVHPLQLAVCTRCWLVQLLEVVDHVTLFGTGYSFYSSASPPLSWYHHQYADSVLDTHGDIARGTVVEIGCNDGDLLRHLHKAGANAIGVDPATGPTDVAKSRGLNVLTVAFDHTVGAEMRETYGPVDLVIANHVLAHVENVSSVLAGIAMMLSDDGRTFIEVQYWPDLVLNNAFDLVYHEHRNFFSLGSLIYAAEQHGLHVNDATLTSRQGGSLRVELSKLWGTSPNVTQILAQESWLSDLSAYGGLQGRVERLRTRLRQLIHAELLDERRMVGYGAPAKATTLLNFCDINTNALDYVIDTTAAKQGRHIPGTGLRIIAPEDAELTSNTTCLVLAWNYSQTIMRNHAEFTRSGGRWILPVPAPTLI